ncbi:MAG: hypothetical protein GTN78_04225, partial [Gemmatimonadales bacterium]|nr:hypothetical protein [Gemmatimonadales bacterium]
MTVYLNTGLAAGRTYYYRVRAYNAGGASQWSNTDGATTPEGPSPPAAPSGLLASALSASEIRLTWTDNSDNEDGFKIERSLSAATGFAQIAAVGANVTSYADGGLTADTTYYYRLRASNGAGDSPYSNTAGATTAGPAPEPPAAPSGLAAAGAGDHILVTWVDNSTDENNFDLWRRREGSYWSALARLSANVTSYRDYSAQAGITYHYI